MCSALISYKMNFRATVISEVIDKKVVKNVIIWLHLHEHCVQHTVLSNTTNCIHT